MYAHRYGFKHVYTPLDVKAWNQAYVTYDLLLDTYSTSILIVRIWPFVDLTDAEAASTVVCPWFSDVTTRLTRLVVLARRFLEDSLPFGARIP